VDKRGITARQGEVLYRAAVARVVRHCVERHPRINLCLDKRYTNRTQQAQAAQLVAEKVVVEEEVRGIKIAALPGGR